MKSTLDQLDFFIAVAVFTLVALLVDHPTDGPNYPLIASSIVSYGAFLAVKQKLKHRKKK